jgi:DHA2 family multidrug resistance protein-like MFS transporter
VAAAGFVVLSQVNADGGLIVAVMGSVLFALGISPAVALATDLIVGAAPPERAGTASGMSEASTELGGALGIAILGAVGLAVYRTVLAVPPALSPEAATAARNTLGGALAVADQLPTESAVILRLAARDAFTQGLHVTALISAGIALALAAMAAVVFRRSRVDNVGYRAD